jgi:hypothetical protein
MKVIALTYDYDLSKLAEIGRKWAPEVYGNKDYIFEYSAASYATFLDKNPTRIINLYTDDIEFAKEKMSKYAIDQERIIYHDFRPQLAKYTNGMRYSFDVLTDFIHFGKSETEFTLKIDNDLVFHSEIPEPESEEGLVYVWKYERRVYQGDPRMGEIKVAQTSVSTTDIPIYNLGIFGLPITFPEQELRDVCDKMINVDISDVSDLGATIWHCAEQTANNWIFQKYAFKVVEMHPYVTHHYDNKQLCIKHAEYLLKK